MKALIQNRRDFLKTIGTGLAAALLPDYRVIAERGSTEGASIRPNFIIVFADDLRYQDVGCFGSPQIRTPRIDQMAQEGIRCTSFYAQTVCGPSRAALMTGCYPLGVAKRNNQLDIHPYLHSKEVTVAKVLRDAGYATGCFGKWDLRALEVSFSRP